MLTRKTHESHLNINWFSIKRKKYYNTEKLTLSFITFYILVFEVKLYNFKNFTVLK